MGTDKALLLHPDGGTWLETTLRKLAALGVPITLFTRHAPHLELAAVLAPGMGVGLEPEEEPFPREGPLLALARLMELHPGKRLLLCPVDMPWLEVATLRSLVVAAERDPRTIHVADDGERLQPLLGIYPADPLHRSSISCFSAAGGRSLLRWLTTVGVHTVRLQESALRNVNRPEEGLGIEVPGSDSSAPG